VTVGIALAAVLAATGCAGRADPAGHGAGSPSPDTANPQGSPDSASLRGRKFTAKAITEQGTARPVVAGTSIELWFTDDGRVVVNAGCNTMSGTVSLAGGRLDVPDMSITEMGCDQLRHEQDQRLSALLASKPSWRLDGENLVLSSPSAEVVLIPRDVRPLVGTTWKLDTLIQGDVAGSGPAGVGATLVFGPDEVTVSGLCNLRTVKYQASGSTITFELGPLTKMSCAPEIMAVESAAVALFDGQAAYKIDTDTLTITKGDKGLHFTAED